MAKRTSDLKQRVEQLERSNGRLKMVLGLLIAALVFPKIAGGLGTLILLILFAAALGAVALFWFVDRAFAGAAEDDSRERDAVEEA